MLNAQAIEFECGQHRRVGVLRREPVADLGTLLGRRFARISVGLDDEVSLRCFGPVLPNLVDRVPRHWHQLGAAAGERFLRLVDPVARVQPRIVADPRALGRMLLQPFRGARLGDRLVAPLGRADLLANLQSVTPIDKDRGFLRQHNRRPRRALETGQPRQPLGVAADIFAHMLVGQRHDKAVELLGFQLFAKRGQAIGVTGHRLTPSPLS